MRFRRSDPFTGTSLTGLPEQRQSSSSLAALVAEADTRPPRPSLGQPSDTDMDIWRTLARNHREPEDAAQQPVPPCTCDLCTWACQFPDTGRPCTCEDCRAVRPPSAAVAVLYAQPDAVWLTWRAAIRDGRYDDIDALFDAVDERARTGFAAAERHARRALGPVQLQVEARRQPGRAA
jgi:hypothetical protein